MIGLFFILTAVVPPERLKERGDRHAVSSNDSMKFMTQTNSEQSLLLNGSESVKFMTPANSELSLQEQDTIPTVQEERVPVEQDTVEEERVPVEHETSPNLRGSESTGIRLRDLPSIWLEKIYAFFRALKEYLETYIHDALVELWTPPIQALFFVFPS